MDVEGRPCEWHREDYVGNMAWLDEWAGHCGIPPRNVDLGAALEGVVNFGTL
jgi:hypothetical protein